MVIQEYSRYALFSFYALAAIALVVIMFSIGIKRVGAEGADMALQNSEPALAQEVRVQAGQYGKCAGLDERFGPLGFNDPGEWYRYLNERSVGSP